MLPILLPPLRERGGDLALLVKFYIDAFNREFHKDVRGVAPETIRTLEAYPWPGNVRELRNAVERAMLLAEGPILSPADFQMLGARSSVFQGFRLSAEGVDLDQLERDLVTQALQRSGGNQTRAAALLGLNRDQIRYRIEKCGIEKKSFAKP